MNDKELFTAFTDQLTRWSKSGVKPKLADFNTRTYLDLQQKRLEEKALKRSYSFELTSNVFKIGDSVIGQLLNGYNKRVNYAMGNQKIEYFHNQKRIFSETANVPLYQFIKMPSSENTGWKQDTYVCPNCGNIEKIELLISDGCAYCGTHFVASEFYPKVTNFYTLNTCATKKMTPKKLGKLTVISLILATILTALILFTDLESGSTAKPFGVLFPIALVISFLLCLWISPAASQIAEFAPVSTGSIGSKKQITKQLLRYDPSFSYDYFEGKALSLLRMIIYAEQPAQFIQYEGKNLSPSFADIVDMEYRGGMRVEKIDQVEDFIEVTLNVFMRNTYFTNGSIKKRNDTMHIRMRHRAKRNVVPDFTIRKVACHHCGGSFDAMKYRSCPYCNQTYDAGIDDWSVLEISN